MNSTKTHLHHGDHRHPRQSSQQVLLIDSTALQPGSRQRPLVRKPQLLCHRGSINANHFALSSYPPDAPPPCLRRYCGSMSMHKMTRRSDFGLVCPTRVRAGSRAHISFAFCLSRAPDEIHGKPLAGILHHSQLRLRHMVTILAPKPAIRSISRVQAPPALSASWRFIR